MLEEQTRTIAVPASYRLAVSVGPAIWVGDRSARHAWIDDALVWCGREGERVIWRRVWQPAPGILEVFGSADPSHDAAWVAGTLHPDQVVASWQDSLLDELACRFPGLASYGDGSLFDGLITTIVGQSISVQSAAVTQARLAYLFHDGIEVGGRRFAPLPAPGQLADAPVELIRSSGVTMRRAEALKAIARIAAEGGLPSDERARAEPESVARELRDLPLVGPWTAISTLLWGVGAADAWPTGDVALLRAVRHALGSDEHTLKTMDALAEPWRPHRGIAARLLWTNLFSTG